MKKRFASLTAAALTISALMPLHSSAIYWVSADPDAYYREIGAVKLDEKYTEMITAPWGEYLEGAELYLDRKHGEIICEKPLKSSWRDETYAAFKTSKPTAECEELNAALAERFGSSVYFTGTIFPGYELNRYQLHIDNTDEELLRNVCAYLKETTDITDFRVHCEFVQLLEIEEMFFYSETYYEERGVVYLDIDDHMKAVSEYAEANGLTIDTEASSGLLISRTGRENIDELLDLALEIYDATGCSPLMSMPESIPQNSEFGIDVLNSVKGDANCDGELTIADAAAILQYLGNADRYPLTAQGRFNADINGDGLTTADATEIQKLAANAG